MLLAKTDGEISTSKIFGAGKASAISAARKSFLKGNGIGLDVICNYEGSLALGDVRVLNPENIMPFSSLRTLASTQVDKVTALHHRRAANHYKSTTQE